VNGYACPCSARELVTVILISIETGMCKPHVGRCRATDRFGKHQQRSVECAIKELFVVERAETLFANLCKLQIGQVHHRRVDIDVPPDMLPALESLKPGSPAPSDSA
jgi:hypothetical protein